MTNFNVSDQSILFITLDSCRHDTFVASKTPNFDLVAATHKAQSPSHFTYGSHAAMFAGFTPGVSEAKAPFINPKYARLFRLNRMGWPGISNPGFEVDGHDIVDGFRNAGYMTIGTGAVGWFDPAYPVTHNLTRGFDEFFYAGSQGIETQITWLLKKFAERSEGSNNGSIDCFAFMNVGETHVPYFFRGAPWPELDNPCVPFQNIDRSEECRLRQKLCLEFIDRTIEPIIHKFLRANIIVCADHGDCWGEDGLWEHGISHEMTLTVPLLIRHNGKPI